MKNKILAIMILLGLLLTSPLSAFAQSPGGSSSNGQTSLIDIGANEATVSFADLGFRESSLVSPFDSTSVFFSIPANWRLAPGGQVQLDYEVTLSGADVGLAGNKNPYGGTLTVSFN